MHPSLTDAAQEEKRREYEWRPAWERQRISDHTPHTKAARQQKQTRQRRMKTKAGNRTRRQQRNRK